MTSTELVKAEIRRFLESTEPEALCVTGDWGVGKTYTWQKILDETKAAKTIALERYSYASLFGINSLEGLKLALFENLEILDSPPETKFQEGVQAAKSLGAQAKRLTGLASALPIVGPAFAKAGPLYFSLIRHQIICIDDLERRGGGLDVKDVFGLVSFLREQRGCKVMLLLNADALEDGKKQFDTYFEKVIDTRLVFAPTPAEATAIALAQDDEISQLLRANCTTLGISNIRVIKKIERLTKQIMPLLKQVAPEVIESALRSLALFGWSKFQPHLAPPFEFFRTSSLERYMERKKNKTEPSVKEQEWSDLLSRYQFSHLDDFDREIWKFVDSGILDSKEAEMRAKELNEQVRLQKEAGSYEKSWRVFHDSFDENTEEVMSSIVRGVKDSIRVTSLSNLNASVKILKELDRGREAKELIAYFVNHKTAGSEYWNERDPFHDGPFDQDLQAAVDIERAKGVKPFIFEIELAQAAQNLDSVVIKKLSEVPVDDYYTLVKSKTGDEMRKIILSALDYRKYANASPEMMEVVRRMKAALRKIGAESKLNALRVARYDVAVDES